jgi:sugar lactone lactonase YvrE
MLSEIGCVSSDSTDGIVGSNHTCSIAPGLVGADAVLISGDGSTVYVAGSDLGSVDAFVRSPASGLLIGERGCYVADVQIGTSCLAAQLFAPVTSLALIGGTLYAGATVRGAISGLPTGGFGFADPATPSGPALTPCIAVNGLENDCVNGAAMNSVDALAPSPDGRTLYAASIESRAIDSFAPASTGGGALTQTSCAMNSPPPGPCSAAGLITAPTGLAVSPRDGVVYAADAGDGATNRIVALSPSSQGLQDIGCYDEKPLAESGAPTGLPSCTALPGLDHVHRVAVSPDGSTLFAVGDGVVSAFTVQPGDTLTEMGCAVALDSRCSTPTGVLGATALAVSPDGNNVYVAAAGSGAVTAFGLGASVTGGTVQGLVSTLTVSCPDQSSAGCSGRVLLARAAMYGPAMANVSSTDGFTLAPGASTTVRVLIARRLAARAAQGHPLVLAAVVEPFRGGGGATATTVELRPTR